MSGERRLPGEDAHTFFQRLEAEEREQLRAALRPFVDDAGALREGGELFGLPDDVPVEVRVSAKQMRAAMAVLE